jgi:hypothetical protein
MPMTTTHKEHSWKGKRMNGLGNNERMVDGSYQSNRYAVYPRRDGGFLDHHNEVIHHLVDIHGARQ